METNDNSPANSLPTPIAESLRRGCVIPASPLALTSDRQWDLTRQRALWRYYADAGAGGIAIGVHTTQFTIREAGLYQPLLQLANEELNRIDQARERPLIRVCGICGDTAQAVREAQWARDAGFHCGLLSLAAWRAPDGQARIEQSCIEHCARVGEVLPIFGFYLQPAVGGVELPYSFWRALLELESVVAIKVAPFDRYRTIDVIRAVADSDRHDVALYTGNDDNIVSDLLQTFQFERNGEVRSYRFAGGLLGQWACWTRRAVELLAWCHQFHRDRLWRTEFDRWIPALTDANAVIFDVPHQFAGCIPGIHEVLRRQGLLAGTECLDPNEQLSLGQSDQLDRIGREYPFLNDDAFVAENLDRWLS